MLLKREPALRFRGCSLTTCALIWKYTRQRGWDITMISYLASGRMRIERAITQYPLEGHTCAY